MTNDDCLGCQGLSGLHNCDPASRPCTGLLGRAAPMAHSWNDQGDQCNVCCLRRTPGSDAGA